jgi:hypothetical protein
VHSGCAVAHRTVRCAHRQHPLSTARKWLGAINTPNPLIPWHPSFLKITFNTRAGAFTPRHNSKDQTLSNFQNSSQPLSDLRERVCICVILHSCCLDCLSSFLTPFLSDCKAKQETTSVWWSLQGLSDP